MAQRGYINFAWGQLHYRSINIDTDLPMLIMLHQSPLSSRNYEKLLPYLSKKLRVVAIDTPGFGSSDRLSVDWEVNDYAKMVFDCADQFNVSTFNLFGRATGSVFALEASLMNSDRIKNLIIHGIPVYSPEERKQRLVDFAPPFKITNDGNHLEWIWSRIHDEYPWIDAELATNNLKDFLNSGPDFAASYRSIWRYDMPIRVNEYGKLPNRTLLIAGEKDRIGFMHERAVKLFPDASTIFLKNATDFIAEQNPDIFANVILNFLTNEKK